MQISVQLAKNQLKLPTKRAIVHLPTPRGCGVNPMLQKTDNFGTPCTSRPTGVSYWIVLFRANSFNWMQLKLCESRRNATKT